MKKPLNDLRNYKIGKLDNNINYILIEDNQIDNSSVCVAVKTGTINNPIEFQGLAHFLEHMLFLGSKKYPKENYFDEKVQSYGGSSNAWTDTFETVYYFDVQTKHLEEMVDIFSRFFIDPLFDKDSVNREVNAVDSEHKKNINNDTWRTRQIIYNLAKKDSMINQFGTGDLNSLNKPGLRDRMIKFYKEHYVSDNIAIGIISNLTTDKTLKMSKKYFGKIEKKEAPKLVLNKPFYDIEKKSYHIIPSANINESYYLWEIPDFRDDIKTKSWTVISNIINEEGLNGLETFLKSKGLIRDITSGTFEEGIFYIAISYISKKDSKRKEVENYLKYFLNKIKKLHWKKISDHYKKVRELKFNYGSREDALDLITKFTISSFYYDHKEFYSNISLLNNININHIKKYLSYLKLDKCWKVFINKNEYKNIKYKIDKNYNAKYGKIKTFESTKTKFNYKLDINSKYIIKPTIIDNLDNYKIPSLVGKRKWYGAVSKYKEPIFNIKLTFTTKEYYNTPKKYLITSLTASIINYYLSRQFSFLHDIGYNINLFLNITSGCLHLNISGFNDKIDTIFDNVITFIKKINVEEIIFSSKVKSIKDRLMNIDKLSSWEYLSVKLIEQVNDFDYNKDMLLKELKNINVDDIQNSVKKIFKGSLTTFFYGNIKLDNMPDVEKHFNKNINLSNENLYEFNKPKTIQIKHPNKEEKNNTLQLIYYCGKYTPKLAIKQLMLNMIMRQPFYDKLRTKDQLGYRVASYMNTSRKQMYFNQKIQSEKTIKFINERIDIFNNEFNKLLNDMDNNTWINWKNTLRKELEQKEENTSELFNKYNIEILIRDFMFNREFLLLNKLDELTKDDIVKHYNKFINKNNVIKISCIKQ